MSTCWLEERGGWRKLLRVCESKLKARHCDRRKRCGTGRTETAVRADAERRLERDSHWVELLGAVVVVVVLVHVLGVLVERAHRQRRRRRARARWGGAARTSRARTFATRLEEVAPVFDEHLVRPGHHRLERAKSLSCKLLQAPGDKNIVTVKIESMHYTYSIRLVNIAMREQNMPDCNTLQSSQDQLDSLGRHLFPIYLCWGSIPFMVYHIRKRQREISLHSQENPCQQ